MPTGRSCGKNKVLASMSEKTTIIPPISVESGIKFSKLHGSYPVSTPLR
jgi:hypothetical protein